MLVCHTLLHKEYFERALGETVVMDGGSCLGNIGKIQVPQVKKQHYLLLPL